MSILILVIKLKSIYIYLFRWVLKKKIVLVFFANFLTYYCLPYGDVDNCHRRKPRIFFLRSLFLIESKLKIIVL